MSLIVHEGQDLSISFSSVTLEKYENAVVVFVVGIGISLHGGGEY